MKPWVALAVALAAAACAAPPAAATVRVITWNVHHGADAADRVDVTRLADELAALAPDIVCLQEVDVGVRRSGHVDLPAELARRLGLHAVFGKNIDYQGGDYGNAILSRWPIGEHGNLHYHMLRPGEQRGLLVAAIDTPVGRCTVGCTHIDWRPGDAERVANCAEILGLGAQLDVLAGDFNDLPDSRVHAALATAFADCWSAVGEGVGATYPQAEPRRRIDWLLVRRGSGWAPSDACVPACAASDHRPVLVELRPAGDQGLSSSP